MNTQKPVIILLGPQGSGKGTQGKRLAEKLGLPYLETGALLRSEVASGSERGQYFGSIINDGGHLPDKDVSDFMVGKIREAYSKVGGVIVDGFPRSGGQADVFALAVKPTHVLLVDIPDQESVRRASARWQCPVDGKIYNVISEPPQVSGICDNDGAKLIQRSDDTPEGIQKRLDWYHKDTKPLIERYKAEGVLYRIDGMPPIESVWQSVWTVFK